MNDGKMVICGRKDVHLGTANTKFQNNAQKGLEQRSIPQNRQTSKDFNTYNE
uniref:hypothetical protein n=1 Tax=Alloprevotella sp. TaxID=1872471 RepID=UPI00402938D4